MIFPLLVKKRRSLYVSQKCNKFKGRIEKCGLLDMRVVGSKFTWMRPIYNGG